LSLGPSAPISTIKEPDISLWVNAPNGIKLASRRVHLAAVRSLFRFCTNRDYIHFDPSAEVRVKAQLLSHEQKEAQQKSCFADGEANRIVDHLMLRMLELMRLSKTSAI
jgi:site-specific recombinase XerD